MSFLDAANESPTDKDPFLAALGEVGGTGIGILDEAAVRAMYESADPIHVFATDKALFGELAAKPEFEALLREQVAEVRKLVG